jgi:DNA topoisomerase I
VAHQAARQVARHSEAPSPVASARVAGLRYVDDRLPGFRRRRTGKKIQQARRWIFDFVIENANGRPTRDQATLERIRKLAIPPAWEDVWICPNADGHLQATGRDARGRKQYRYHPHWRDERDGTKFARLVELGRALPALRRRIAADLRLPGLPQRKVLATVVWLLQTTFIRVGNEEYARSNKSFGLTTLKDRHVDVRLSEVRFHFRGKSGVYHQKSVQDPSIARIVRRCRDLPGQELFQYLDDDGDPASINSADVNEYIREAAGQDFTAKDFRTWAGTMLAAVALRQVAGARNGRPTNRLVVSVIKRVAEQLGNTPSVCRKSYIHPYVIAAYLDGTLGSSPASRGDSKVSRSPIGLRPDETTLLTLLRRHRAEEKKGTGLAKQLRRSLRLVRDAA